MQKLRFGSEVESLETLLDGLGAHVGLEILSVAILKLVEDAVFWLELTDLEAAEVFPHALELGDLLVERLTNLAHLLLGAVFGAALLVALGAFCLEGSQVGFELGETVGDARIALVAESLDLETQFVLEAGHVFVTAIDIDRDDHVRSEVDDLLEVFRRHVEQVAEARGNTLEVPDVRDRGGELDVAHALTAHRRLRDLYTTALADDSFEAHALVLAARALPVTARAEDLLSEETVFLGLERAVVDRFGLLDLTV